eukprot:1348923-Ditylum_brightwellii.AAC.1
MEWISLEEEDGAKLGETFTVELHTMIGINESQLVCTVCSLVLPELEKVQSKCTMCMELELPPLLSPAIFSWMWQHCIIITQRVAWDALRKEAFLNKTH